MLLIYHIRSFILAAIAAPLMMAFGARLTNKYERNFLAKLFLRSLILFGGIAVFLSSDGSNYVSGTAIPVDGGYSING